MRQFILQLTSDKIGEDLVEFYSFVKKLILTAPKYLNPKNRPITYIFKVAMKPNVEFIIVTTKKTLQMIF